MNKNSISLSVSIVLYKTAITDVRKVIDSLRLCKRRMHLYLIDNSPTDFLRQECPSDISHDYIHLKHNPGFGSAHNVAIKQSQKIGSEYHLVLNADIYFDCDVLSPMIDYMNNHKKIGLMMPKVLNIDGTVQRLCKLVPTPIDLFLRRFSFNTSRIFNDAHFEMHNTGYDKKMFVPYLSGCFMLLRQSSLKEVGLFDERFFMYPEDIDLSRRMAAKYDTLFFPEVTVTHAHGAASRKSIKMFCIHAFNIIKYFNKWGWFSDHLRTELNNKTLNQFSNEIQ